ncbi:auxin-binding protein T85 [Tanacetum coccineum]
MAGLGYPTLPLQVEIWLQTFAPGAHTPIHRHSCEEVFVVLKGSGTLYLSPNSHAKSPGKPEEFRIFSNSTFYVPVNDVHQERVRLRLECRIFPESLTIKDIRELILIQFMYKDWLMPHTAATLKFPYFWDEHCYQTDVKDEL